MVTVVVSEADHPAPGSGPRRTTQIGPTPYVEWASRPLPEWSTLSPDQLVDGLCEIVGAEGPMHAVRAYQLMIRAAGGQRVGREVRRILNQAAARGVRQGRLAQIIDSMPGQADKTVYLPNTEPVIVRTLGPRPTP